MLGESAIAVRTKAMKCLSEVVAVDPSILARVSLNLFNCHSAAQCGSTKVVVPSWSGHCLVNKILYALCRHLSPPGCAKKKKYICKLPVRVLSIAPLRKLALTWNMSFAFLTRVEKVMILAATHLLGYWSNCFFFFYD